MFAWIVLAQTSPHNVAGRVFHNGTDENGVANGYPVFINNTDSLTTAMSSTNAPPLPQFRGSYSATIEGDDGDNIIIFSWNDTHFGNTTRTLQSTTTFGNVTLNLSRGSEPNVTIIKPNNHTVHSIGTNITLEARTYILRQDGVGCEFHLTISNNESFVLQPGNNVTRYIGNLAQGVVNRTDWTILANATGVSNFSVTVRCLSDSVILERLNTDFRVNNSVEISTPPFITLLTPANNTAETAGVVNFTYMVEHTGPVGSCSLVINDTVNTTDSTIQLDTEINMTADLTVGSYNWSVNCSDSGSSVRMGNSSKFNLSILGNVPVSITAMSVIDPIILNPGGLQTVMCNASITDVESIGDIFAVNVTLYDQAVKSPGGDNDNNDHYHNSSCTSVNSTEWANYTCNFAVQYYANNASWRCTYTVENNGSGDQQNHIDTTVNELLALNASTDLLDYGTINFTNTSRELELILTNFGNINTNITLEGYGSNPGDNLSFDCQRDTNISVGFERFATNTTDPTDYDGMTNLSGEATPIVNFTLYQRINDVIEDNDRNSTYWRVRTPTGVAGGCEGNIIVGAITG